MQARLYRGHDHGDRAPRRRDPAQWRRHIVDGDGGQHLDHGAIGIAVAFRRLEIALLLSAMTWLTLHLPSPAKMTGDASDQDEI